MLIIVVGYNFFFTVNKLVVKKIENKLVRKTQYNFNINSQISVKHSVK
jgi:hypothetical protein